MLILKNSWRNRRRTILTALSIGVSMCLLGLLGAMYHLFYFAPPSQAQALRLITRNRISFTIPMPTYYREKIQRVPGVREVGASQWFNGTYKDARNPRNFFARYAVDPGKIFIIHPEMQLPDDQKAAFQRERTACILGRPLAERHGLKLGDRVTLVGDIFPITLELTVRGIFDAPTDSETLYFQMAYLMESLGPGRRDFAGTFNVLADSPEAAPRVARAIDEMFRNATVQTKTESEQAFALSFLSFLGNVKVFLFSICAAVMFTILLVSANTMAMSARERVGEIGVLKTLGFSPRAIFGIILGEAGMISLVGGILGLLLASLLCAMVRNGPAASFGQTAQLSIVPAVALSILLTAPAIGLLSAFVPAWSASRIPIVEAIRNTG